MMWRIAKLKRRKMRQRNAKLKKGKMMWRIAKLKKKKLRQRNPKLKNKN